MSHSADAPIRLCVISHSCVVAVNQAPWATLATRYPVDLTLFAPRTWRSFRGGLVKLEVSPGLEGRVRPMPVFPRGHPNLHLWLGLGRALAAAAPHIIFLDEEPYSLAAAQILALRCPRRAALVLYAKQNILKRLPLPFSWVERRVLATADVLVAVDTAAQAVLQAKGAQSPISVIPHAIDVGLYFPCDSTELRQKLGLTGFVMGYVGRLVPEKGVRDLLQAAARLKRAKALAPRDTSARSQAEFSVLVVGDGPEMSALRSFADAELPGQVVFTGAVPHTEVPQYYRCMDVLVLPSRTASHWREQFGRVIIEALACGVPVIGSDSGAIPTTIAMTAGLTYPEGDVARLAHLLHLMMADADRRLSLANAGRQRVLQTFTTEAVGQALYAAITEALERHRAKLRHSPAEPFAS